MSRRKVQATSELTSAQVAWNEWALFTLCPWLPLREDYCRRCGQRQAKRSGDPLVTDAGLPEHFAGQLTITDDGCWQWHGEQFSDGRPAFAFGSVYRLLFTALRGPFNPNHHLHHKCFNGWCANPWHTIPMLPRMHQALHERLRRRRLYKEKYPLC